VPYPIDIPYGGGDAVAREVDLDLDLVNTLGAK
jgi:hypothetical protein